MHFDLPSRSSNVTSHSTRRSSCCGPVNTATLNLWPTTIPVIGLPVHHFALRIVCCYLDHLCCGDDSDEHCCFDSMTWFKWCSCCVCRRCCCRVHDVCEKIFCGSENLVKISLYLQVQPVFVLKLKS
jgi:hypothetical protein